MLTREFLILILAFVCCAAQNFDERIINGTNGEIEHFPFLAQVYNTEYIDLFCGGVILSEYYVLTAAQCTHDLETDKVRVNVGDNIVYEGLSYDCEAFFEHPKFEDKGDWKHFDVSVIKLKSPLKFSNRVQTIQLPMPNQKFTEGLRCKVLGWGVSADHSIIDKKRPLQVADTKIVSQKVCAEFYHSRWKIRNWMICAGNGYSNAIKGPCNGDAGGPLVCDNVLAGIVSFGGDGANCNAFEKPYVYTYIGDQEILDFINNAMNQQNVQ